MEAMNEALVENHNATVSKSDLIYHLGDFSWANAAKTEEVLRRLNGSIHLIKGNHDGSLATVVRRNPKLVASFQSYKEIRVGQQRLVLFHFPILSWHQVHYGSWHLHGHCHGNLEFDNGPMLDVGVDVHSFRPIEFDEVATLIKDRSPRLWDHHTTDEGGKRR